MNKSNFKFQEIRREISKAAKNIFCRKWAEIKIKVYKEKTLNSAVMKVSVHSFSPRGSLITARMIRVFAINLSGYFNLSFFSIIKLKFSF